MVLISILNKGEKSLDFVADFSLDLLTSHCTLTEANMSVAAFPVF